MDYFYGAFLVFLELDSLIWHLRHSATVNISFCVARKKKKKSDVNEFFSFIFCFHQMIHLYVLVLKNHQFLIFFGLTTATVFVSWRTTNIARCLWEPPISRLRMVLTPWNKS